PPPPRARAVRLPGGQLHDRVTDCLVPRAQAAPTTERQIKRTAMSLRPLFPSCKTRRRVINTAAALNPLLVVPARQYVPASQPCTWSGAVLRCGSPYWGAASGRTTTLVS